MNEPWSGRIGFDFLPQSEHIDIDSAIRDGAILSPDSVQQLLPAEDDAGAAHQEFKQPELGGGERKGLAGESHFAAAAIEFDAAGLQGPGWRVGAAELKLDARNDFADKERLHNVVVSAKFQADNAVGFGRAGGKKDDGGLGQLRIVANGFAYIKPVGIRQHDVEQD